MNDNGKKNVNGTRSSRYRLWIVLAGGLLIGFGFGFMQSYFAKSRNKLQPTVTTSLSTQTPGFFTGVLPTATGISLEEAIERISTQSAEDWAAIPGIGKTAPDFTLQDLNGDPVTFKDYENQPVILNFWASWCSPCREEMPLLQTVYEKYADQGLVVLAVNETKEDSEENAKQFVSDLQLSFPVVLDPQNDITVSLYRVLQLPMSYFIDESGIIQAVHIGQMDEDILEASIEKILP